MTALLRAVEVPPRVENADAMTPKGGWRDLVPAASRVRRRADGAAEAKSDVAKDFVTRDLIKSDERAAVCCSPVTRADARKSAAVASFIANGTDP
jgi:hypothetical protein